MKNFKTVFKAIKGFFKGVFDLDPSKKITGCCGGYVPKALIDENIKTKESENESSQK